MSRLDELIEELCPNGITHKAIWELTAWDKKFNTVEKTKQKKIIKYNYILAAELKSYESAGGSVKILTTSVTDLWADEEQVADIMSEGEIVCIPWGGNPIVQYYKGKFVTGDNRIATALDTSELDNKYLYYCMQNRIQEIGSFYRGSGIKHPDMSKVLDLEVPVPPIEVQSEIVRILDNFTELTAKLTAKLTAELTARKKQYEYYRDSLLSMSNVQCEMCNLGDVVQSIHTGLNPRHFFKLNTEDATNYYVTIREFKGGKLVFNEKTDRINDFALNLCNNRSNLEIGDVLFSGTGTIGETYVIEETPNNWNIKEGVYSIKPRHEVLFSKYLKYYLSTKKMHEKYDLLAEGGTVKSISMKKMSELKIAIPPLDVQKKIADTLDNFDAICSDLKIGLPAEIEARQKQYEYYRDLLLTFAEDSSQFVNVEREREREQESAEVTKSN